MKVIEMYLFVATSLICETERFKQT